MVEGLRKSSSVTEPGPLDPAGIPEGFYLWELVVTGPVGWRWGRGDRHEAHRLRVPTAKSQLCPVVAV